ncbi:MAG: FtsQ-type POTRA domain-containing protein [Thermoleophilia bacterium]|nr:FtsQ-type POTRA domain-containing protein [Thermoleophilia bacterium]
MFSIIWKASLAVLLIGIGAGAAFWLSQSSVLAIDKIVVEGNRAVSTEEIMEKAGPLLRGQSLVRPPLDTVRGELGSFAYVESIEFDRDLPGTVIIRVKEYRSFISLRAADGKIFILSSEGKVLAEQGATPVTLPVVSTKEPCAAEVGRQTECADVLTATGFLTDIPMNFNYEFAEVSVDNGDISATTRSGVKIHFGTMVDYEMKFEVLRQLLVRSTAAGVEVFIDVSVPERPVTKETAPPPPPEPVETAPIEESAPEDTTAADEAAAAAAAAALETDAQAPVQDTGTLEGTGVEVPVAQ